MKAPSVRISTLGILLFVSVFLFGCTFGGEPVIQNWQDLNPGNSANDQDDVGLRHNQLVEAFADEQPQRSGPFDTVRFAVPQAIAIDESVTSANADEAHVYGALTALVLQDYDPATQAWTDWGDYIHWLLDKLTTIEDQVRHAITNGALREAISNQEQALVAVDQFRTNVESYSHAENWHLIQSVIDRTQSAEDSIQQTISGLKSVDTQITQLAATDVRQALGAANATARFSTAYWGAGSTWPDSPWPAPAKPNWRRIVGKDLVGGLTGFIGGGWLGSVVGGAVASIEEALDQEEG